MPKVRRRATAKELQSLLTYCERTGHFYWKECEDPKMLEGYRNPIYHHIKAGTRADHLFYHSFKHQPYYRILVFGQLISAHQVAWMIKTGLKASRVGHIDRDTSNNRWSNLTSKPRGRVPPRPTSFHATIKGSRISIKNY